MKRNTHGGRRAGAGRPRKYDEPTRPRWIRLPEMIDDRIVQIAEEEGRTVSEVAVELLKRALAYKRR